MVDPGHCKRSASKYLFGALGTRIASISRVTKSMAERLTKSWGYMVQQNEGLTIKDL